jgi:hypothetical protein
VNGSAAFTVGSAKRSAAHRRQHRQAAGVAAERLTVFVAHEEQIRPPVATGPMRYLPGGIFCCADRQIIRHL